MVKNWTLSIPEKESTFRFIKNCSEKDLFPT